MWLSLLYFTQGIGATFGIFGGMPLAPLKSAYAQLTCTSSLQHWLWHNGLLINPHKSVAALFRTRQRLARPGWPTHVAVAGSDIKCPTIWRFLVSHSTRRWRSTLKWQRQSGLVIFIYSPCDSSGALCLVMLHRASLVPSSDRGWITATLCITACQTRI